MTGPGGRHRGSGPDDSAAEPTSGTIDGGTEPTGPLTPDFSAPVPSGLLPDVPGVRLEQQIGRGGYATVYRGRQQSVDRDVAVKVDDRRLLDERDRRRFTREIVAAGAVSAHPHIVTVYDGGTTADAHPYLVMELYPGGSYSDRMRSGGPIPPAEVLAVGVAIADALAIAHAEGILHRDVKPGNILISRYGSAALADFGLAALPRAADGYSVTMESLTPSYASPEAFGGAEPTAAMDIYSLGATLYALLLGRAPRSDASGSAPPLVRLLFLLNEPLPALEVQGAQALMPVIWRATAFDPSQRYATADQMRDDLEAVAKGHAAAAPATAEPATATGGSMFAGTGSGVKQPHPGVTTVPPAGHRRWWVAAAAAVAVLLVAAAVFVAPGDKTSGVAEPGPAARSDRPISAAVMPSASTSAFTSAFTAVVTSAVTPVSKSAGTSAGPPAATRSTAGTAPTVPSVGSCWGGLVDIGGVTTASEIPCAAPHYWESYAVGVLAAATPTPYDDDVARDPVVVRTCTRAALATYLGTGRQESLDVEVVPPRELAFAAGQKTFWCVASVPGAGRVTGSIRKQ